MKKKYDFSKGRRGAAVPTRGKTQITLFLDEGIVQHFRELSDKSGKGYQTLINEVLATHAARKRHLD